MVRDKCLGEKKKKKKKEEEEEEEDRNREIIKICNAAIYASALW